MSHDNWDDLRYVLAVVDEGSVSAAARRLGVNHATVLRRIAAFETRIGADLFDKTAKGYRVPADRARVVAAAREVDRAVQAVSRMIEGVRAPLSGEVRVTSTDSFCQMLLPGLLARISRDEPGLKVTLLSSNAHMDLGRVHADITVRPTARLPEELTGNLAARLGFSVYAAKAVTGGVAEPGKPGRWLGLAGALERTIPGLWQARAVDPALIGDAADSFLILREMAAEARGMAILPKFLGQPDARLREVAGLMPPMAVDIWVASHADLADVPRIALMRRLLTEGLAELAPRLDP